MVGRRDLLKRVGAGAAVIAAGGAVATQAVAAADDAPRKVALILLDRSGSMSDVRKATVDGLNTFLDEQRDKPDLHIGLIQFDSSGGGLDITPTISFLAAPQCPCLTEADYQPRGSTPLLAAVADAIKRLEQVVRPQDRALLVVQTDGYENASPPEITKQVIKDLIAAKEAEGNWTFAFMGADIDAWGAGGSIGINVANTLQYRNDYAGTQAAYASTSGSTQSWYASDDANSQSFFAPAKGAARANP